MFETLFRKFILTQKQDRSSPRQPILWIGLALLVIFMVACSAPAVAVVETAVPPTTLPPTDVPPTEMPETAVPATDVPPTEIAVSSEALIDAIKADDVVEVQRLLEAGVDPNLDNKGAYPMIVAVSRGNAEIVKLLVEHGGDVTIKMSSGETLIDFATSRQQFQVVEFLDEQILELEGIVRGEITSPALANNLIGDSNTKSYTVYLPPNYNNSNKRYPVVYFLHGNTEDETSHIIPFKAALDEMIAAGDAPEMIAVFPNAKTAFLGIGLYDSPTTGDYPTYLSHDLVNHIDANFRTIPNRDSRGIVGCGDATTNVLNLAFTHPDVFSVPVAMTGIYGYENHKLIWQMSTDAFKGMPADFEEIEANLIEFWPALFLMNLAAGAAPNPDNPPFYLDMPLKIVDGQAQIVPEVAAKINALDPTHLLQTYLDQPTRFRGMLIYQKNQQDHMPVESARAFDALLTQHEVAHEYIEARGGNAAPFFCDYELAAQFMAEHLFTESLE